MKKLKKDIALEASINDLLKNDHFWEEEKAQMREKIDSEINLDWITSEVPHRSVWKKIFFFLIFLVIIFALYNIFIQLKLNNHINISNNASTKIETNTWDIVSEFIEKETNEVIEVMVQEESVLTKMFSRFNTIATKNHSFFNIWWEENISENKDGSFRLKYPKGSYIPSKNPIGWAWFIYKFGEAKQNTSLSYSFILSENFDFVKWGKLAGLCGWTCPRGWDDNAGGFSTLFSWKQGGYLDMNLVYPGAPKYGKNTGKKLLVLIPGKKYTIKQDITLNTPGEKNGIIKVYVNNVLVFKADNYTLRTSKNVSIDSLIFSSFFAGWDITYATPVDTYIDFSNFKLSK